jgi:hypothetical protein
MHGLSTAPDDSIEQFSSTHPGRTSQTKEAILPDPDKVPKPSAMTGESPDPAKLKRVKIK